MPFKFDRFEIDHKGVGMFLSSQDLGRAVGAAAEMVRAKAASGSKTIGASFRVVDGPPLRIGKYSRLTKEVENSHSAAAAIEFGSGTGRPGNAVPRPQGGYSEPQRLLGKAGAEVGDYSGGLE